ncbi:MAG: Fic family protein [Candidatus Nitrotoga sp.]|nr:Fic family protein [Candidatus Nitrotoga sp.]
MPEFDKTAGGHWKAINNNIIERHPDGSSRIHFRPVAAQLMPMSMTDTTARYRTALDQHLADPLVLVPLVILDFLRVHPFSDENGRMARLLTLQLLYHADYTVDRFISLERIFEESKESYYETLESSSQGWHEGAHNIAAWLDYFWGALLRAYKEFEERVGPLSRGRGAKGDWVRAEILKRDLPFSISEIEAACPGVSRDMVRLVLRAMKAEGLIAPTGKGRGAVGQCGKWPAATRTVIPYEYRRKKGGKQ